MTAPSNARNFMKISSFRTVFALLVGAGTMFSSACSSTERGSFERDTQDASEPVGAFGDDGGTTEVVDSGNDKSCAQATVTAETVPLAMLVLIDRSGSMAGDKWTAATSAIRTFADRAEVVGMQMGLNFFPPLGTGDQCAYSTYAQPAVGVAPLPDNVIPIQQKLASTDVTGSTPMSGGLGGSIEAMRSFLQENPASEPVIILVTDGDPAGCGTLTDVIGIASDGANPKGTEPRVRTFVVGMQGATFSNLDKIAVAGGGFSTAFNVGTGTAAQQGLVDALEAVRTGAIGCEYILPPPPSGRLDLESVEVRYSPGGNDPVQTMRKVDSKGDCGQQTGGYYYDNPTDPTRVVLCPASCDLVRSAPAEAKVELFFGCISVTK